MKAVSFTPEITRHATVRPRIERSLFAPVSGQIGWVSEHVVPGHYFSAESLLAQIDAGPFVSAVAEAEAQLAASELSLLQEERSAKLARARRAGTTVSEAAPLVLREPYLHSARLRRDADKEALDATRADLEKLDLRAPFPLMITSHKLYPGAYVTAGDPVAELISAGDLVIDLPLTQDEWAQLVPRNLGQITANTIVGQVKNDRGQRFDVFSERILAASDDITKQPVLRLGIELPQDQLHALLPGAFVQVVLRGPTQVSLQKTPASARTLDNRIWYVLSDENLLRSTSVSVNFEQDGHSFLPEGTLPENAQVLVNPLSRYAAGERVTVKVGSDG
ncbi:HlyD family efflux transporter periplasmic adaptor subunit [Rhodobacteraceae bacterium B1Z28]|uniref:HlyD family efflux transporter periplasmic adaptor subunit n=1 Tax=Ruegeria haliotis TaxID=2747601 RepID=A0ABX2PT39_9RHOB|nr:HlyD family efflux transporter periplasmic adaptor subunit [Ruegeria haliotis]NVO57343.1 HlyD family efflux transporter periplasmic adaptor subunit [Ruegeria haliotis]